MPAGITCSTLPLGPSTTTVLPLTVYFTPVGSGIGFFPIRDILQSFYGLRVPTCIVPLQPEQAFRPTTNSHSMPTAWPILIAWARMARNARVRPTRPALPDFAEDLAAYTFAARLASGHHAPRRGEDADAQSTLHPLDLIAADVNAAARTGNAREVADRSFVVRAVLEIHAKNGAAILFGRLVVRDVALFLEDAGDFGLQLRGRNIQLLVTRANRVTNAGQKICYWIGQTHRFSFIPRSSATAETSGNG